MSPSYTYSMRRCCKVPGVILLQAVLCSYTLTGGVNFEVTLNSCTLSLLPLLETVMELLLQNVLHCYHVYVNIFDVLTPSSLEVNVSAGKSQKSCLSVAQSSSRFFVMGVEPIVASKFRVRSVHSLMQSWPCLLRT